jgi:hypothetical protein
LWAEGVPVRKTAQKPAPAETDSAVAQDRQRLRGPWLWVVRAVWLVMLTGAVVPFVTALPLYVRTLEHICVGSCAFTPGAAHALGMLGVSVRTYAQVSTGLAALIVLVAVVIALVLFWQRSDEWMVLVVAYFLVGYPQGNISQVVPSPSPAGALNLLLLIPGLLSVFLFYAIFLLFPSGRFVPRWSWLVLVAWIIWYLAKSSVPQLADSVLVLGYPAFYLTAILCQVHRYRTASTSIQRQQTKWIVAGFVISLLANQVFWLPSALTPLGNTLYPPVAFLVLQICLLFLPITFFIAIQRYRLYDIDRLINRTLVYGSLTGLLGAIYVTIIYGMGSVAVALTGQESSSVVLVVATLTIAALFNPLRRRLQTTIDRRFYRGKYDAARTLAAFAGTLRGEIDFADLRAHLLEVVDDTMQPEHVSLWLPANERNGTAPR